jgi:hypothetical protein
MNANNRKEGQGNAKKKRVRDKEKLKEPTTEDH